MIKRDLSLVHKADSTCRNQCNHHINRLKKRKIILSYQYKYKIQNLFMIKKKKKKPLRTTKIEENFLNLIKNIYKKPIANITLNSDKLGAFPLNLETRQGCYL